MVDRDQGLIQSQGSGFSKVDPHQYCTNQSRRIGHSHSIDLLPGDPCLFQSLICKAINGLDMLSGCNFRYHTAVNAVKGNLGSYTVG